MGHLGGLEVDPVAVEVVAAVKAIGFLGLANVSPVFYTI
jgi:hypothetical protein